MAPVALAGPTGLVPTPPAAALGGKETANFEFPLYTKKSERVEILLNAATRRDANGQIVGVVGVGQDITELNAGKAELARVANDLKMLIVTAAGVETVHKGMSASCAAACHHDRAPATCNAHLDSSH